MQIFPLENVYLAVPPWYEKVVSHTGLPVFGSLDHGVLGVVGEVRAVGQGEGAGLQFLVELSPTEPVLLLCKYCLSSPEIETGGEIKPMQAV